MEDIEIKMDKKFFIKHIESFITIAAVIVTGTFWIFTMTGIPERVSRLETDVEAIKTQLSKNDTKTDIILEDTKFIKQLIIQKHSD